MYKRAANAVLWVLQVLAALCFLVAALGKFTGAEPIVATFDAIGVGDWLRYLVGVLETLGALALLVPRLAGLAALAFVGLMVGAAYTELVIADGSGALPLVLLLMCAVVAWGRWRRTAQLWASLVRPRMATPHLSED
jgi:uncharacterized membrane protein YphA (DoxX/SURF4 family)